MDEYRLNILKQSDAEISRLQLLSAFFDHEIIYKIYLRIQVIHQLFASNEELEINKLDLFHLQFTHSIIELLKKIKKSNEKNVSLIYDEMVLNQQLIDQISTSLTDQHSFKLDQHRQSLKINQSLRRLYEVLSNLNSDFPFAKNINTFSARYANDFYFDLSAGQFSELINQQGKRLYTHTYATIEQKLMGKLCKYDFKTEFHLGLRCGDQVIEIYRFLNQSTYFLFFPARNLFLFCDMQNLKLSDDGNNISDRQRMIEELQYKNDQLKSNAAIIKTSVSSDILTLLTNSYQKISDINFLNEWSNYDVQSNILKEMLRTDLF